MDPWSGDRHDIDRLSDRKRARGHRQPPLSFPEGRLGGLRSPCDKRFPFDNRPPRPRLAADRRHLAFHRPDGDDDHGPAPAPPRGRAESVSATERNSAFAGAAPRRSLPTATAARRRKCSPFAYPKAGFVYLRYAPVAVKPLI